jgi:hypothetical protein
MQPYIWMFDWRKEGRSTDTTIESHGTQLSFKIPGNSEIINIS